MTTNPVLSSKTIRIPNYLWLQTWGGLRDRGQGSRESAAIWGGKRIGNSETVEAVYYLDDFEGGFRSRAYHFVSTEALAQLFAKLHREKHVIIGDVHTHPTSWVGLSQIDREHPIEFRHGLHALVLPSFALLSPSLRLTGVHVYQGDGKWQTLNDAAKSQTFIFTE